MPAAIQLYSRWFCRTPPTDVIKEHALNLEDIISYILLTLGWRWLALSPDNKKARGLNPGSALACPSVSPAMGCRPFQGVPRLSPLG